MGSTFLSSKHRHLTRPRRRRQRERQKHNRFYEQNNNSARESRFFCTFLCRPCTTTTWNDPVLSWLENANGKTINLTVSPWTRVHWSPLFSSKLISLLLSNWVTWYEGKKKLTGREVYFSATLSLASPLSDLFWPFFICFVHAASAEFTDGWKLSVTGPFTRNRSIVSLRLHETDEPSYS